MEAKDATLGFWKQSRQRQIDQMMTATCSSQLDYKQLLGGRHDERGTRNDIFSALESEFRQAQHVLYSNRPAVQYSYRETKPSCSARHVIER